MATRQGERLLSTREAAELLGISPRTLSRWRTETDAKGRPIGPQFVKMNGKVVRYRPTDLEAFVEANEHAPGDGDFAA